MKKPNNLLAVYVLVLVIIFVTIAGFAGYYLGKQTQTNIKSQQVEIALTPPSFEPPSVTKSVKVSVPNDWQTYKNSTYKFSFKYPGM